MVMQKATHVVTFTKTPRTGHLAWMPLRELKVEFPDERSGREWLRAARENRELSDFSVSWDDGLVM